MNEAPAKDSIVFWQTELENGVAEPAVLIEFYSDSVSLVQDGNRISLNNDSLSEFIKILKDGRARNKNK